MHVAVGTSLATIIPTSISSLRAHNKKGAVDWALLKRWLAPMLVGVLAGSVLAGVARGQTLTLIFGVVALPVAAQLAFGKENVAAGGPSARRRRRLRCCRSASAASRP